MAWGISFGGSSSKEERVESSSTPKVYRMMKIDGKMVEVDSATGKPVEKPAAESQNPQATTATSESVQAPVSPRAVNSPISVAEKPQVAPSSPTATVEKTNATSEPNHTDNAAEEDVGSDKIASPVEKEAAHSEDVASGTESSDAQGQEEGIAAVTPDVEKFSYLYDEVLSTNKLLGSFRQDMQELAKKIETLNADTIVKLGERASLIEKQKSELDALTLKEATRAAAIEAVSLENYELKKERQEWGVKAQAFEAEKAALTREIEALKTKVLEGESLLEGKEKEKNDLISAHNAAVSKLNADHEKAVAELEKQQTDEIEALNKSMSEQIQNAHASIEAFVPSKVCDLFDYQIGEVGDVQPKWQAIYAYLGFINGSLRQDAFVKRFREFDAAFYDAMRDTPDLLAECRVRVQKHINEELGKKTGGLLVCWPKIGDACNPDQYTTTSEFGQRISEVISAMIYKKGDDGKVLCQSKGKVATA